ncbi:MULTISPECIES: methyltransferase domain-containing protein [unclassified Mesorhizobium]|uniref:class I SAM-dependent DNA methyltransferase n=1 Tax=unclassified Mesorhizobium TaxID=325217 RepID=UPI000BB0397F|nr:MULTISPECIES: methyltransferase domain-containing protein [unclassified Mesorhizobium]TGT54235.1 methyltransferase domain-containing protein [Mesorhizobium sp. M00.F.Ca.ET.170.01.1.1]AZO09944.1 methyltransferase domain-containing protein [Mesorhizobium sp. M3A.F.Ca.ET.080.04.2.1]PBB86416.1 SAM-dependent methyltransferase [Mesorhizobium sp. WSM3876]RWB75629.1 MAG: methyltransferase domain-containing protein [Mesorhizobium sp.]RWB86480.1 MAG: methyltransferase domain-containing protein [Mesor
MKPLQASSGDLSADRRADFAEMLLACGEPAQAAELLLGALELAPQWAAGWFRLGEMQEAAGLSDQAVQAWSMALKLDATDRLGAALKLQLIGHAPASTAPPSAFVETLFDHFADGFEESLVEKLGYRIPQFLSLAIRAARPGRFRLALDLGCGTGLMGEKLRPMVDRLEGYDISVGMLRKARAKGVYDLLSKADLQHFSQSGAKADLVVATDVFIYVGALERIVAAIAEALVDGGVFAFSVETLADGTDFALTPSRRYAHSEGYVRRVLTESGFSIRSLDSTVIRHDRREPVEGLAVVAEKSKI